MLPYYILIALPVLVYLFGEKYRFTAGKKLLYETPAASIDVFMLMFVLLLALRGAQCGSDTKQYLYIFNEYRTQSISYLLRGQAYEMGYKLLNWLIGRTGGNYQVLLALTSVVCVYPLWLLYKRESEEHLLTIALFLSVAPFVMYFSGIRQALAMSIGVASWYCAREKKLLLFLGTVVLALQFHASAFMLLVLYPLYHARITRKWLWFVVPCMVLVYVFKTQIFSFLIIFLWDEYTGITETNATTVLMLLILFGIYCYVIPDEKQMDKDTIAMRNMLLFSITLQFFAMIHPLAMRMNYYFLIYIPVLIPKIAGRCKQQYQQIARLSVVIMTTYFLYYFITGGINGSDDLHVFPYVPFWQ